MVAKADRVRTRAWLRGFLGLLLFIALLAGLGIVVPRPFFESRPALASQPLGTQREVLVLSSEIHTDLAFPATPDVIAAFSFMAEDGLDPALLGVGYIIAGWGGRSFYIETPTWADLKPGPVFSALTLDRSVMHMGLAGGIDRSHPSVMTLSLDEDAHARLLAAVLASFDLDGHGRMQVLAGAGYTDLDRFYEARGWFNAFAGCNVWTARMLRTAGVTTGWWTPLPAALAASLRLHNPADRFGYSPEAR